MANLTYRDFAVDEMSYLVCAYQKGLKRNPMVSQAQRIVECMMKHYITVKLLNNTEVMVSHNLRTIYEYVEKTGLQVSSIRSDVMLLNNFYTHTRYPGRDAFIATEQDVDAAYAACGRVFQFFTEVFQHVDVYRNIP